MTASERTRVPQMVSDTYTSRSREKVALLVGFASLAVAVLVARGSPPEAYELSIYAGTPPWFWLGSGVALLVAIGVGLEAEGWTGRLGIVLAGVTAFAVASLPVVRSYYFFGAGDSLTHLGWAKDIRAGRLSVLEFLYPGTHSVAVFVADVTGLPLHRSLLVAVSAFTAAFLVFVPLAAWAVTRDRPTTVVAALSALLFLPINNVSVFGMAHPTSQAILFLPVILYLLARYLLGADREDLPAGTPTGALLAVAAIAVVLIHPQQAANVVVVFAAVLGLQLVARSLGWRESDHRLLGYQTAVAAGAFLLWAPRHERASAASTALVDMILEGPEVGAEVGQRAVSLSAVGGSLAVLFLKLFLVSLVFCALAAAVVLDDVRGIDDAPDVGAFVRYFGLALVPLGVLFGAYFLVSYEGLHFRQLGFVMVLVTLLGAIAVARGMDRLSTAYSPEVARTVVGVAFVAMLALSLPTLYQSPYMYQSSAHVTEAQFHGFENAFETGDAGPLMKVRGSGERWADGIYGVNESRSARLTDPGLYGEGSTTVTGENFTGRYLAQNYEGRYLAFTDRARMREVLVYDEFRYDAGGFRSLDATPGLDRVRANGDFQAYLVNGTR